MLLPVEFNCLDLALWYFWHFERRGIEEVKNGNGIGTSKGVSAQLKRNKQTSISRKIWLLYFNRVLRDQGLITPQDYRRMDLIIKMQKG